MNTSYSFSFTASSLRFNDMIRVAQSTFENKEIDYAIEIGNGKEATGKRILRELEKRIAQFTLKQLEILAEGDYTNQKHIAFLSVCKTYGFIRDFVAEVLRDKLLVFDYQISEGEYITFFRKKAELHTQMESLTEVTQKKHFFREPTPLLFNKIITHSTSHKPSSTYNPSPMPRKLYRPSFLRKCLGSDPFGQ